MTQTKLYRIDFCRERQLVHEAFVGKGVLKPVGRPQRPGKERRFDGVAQNPLAPNGSRTSGCAADQDRFLDYAHELFVNQPPEGSAGLSDAELDALGQAVGLTPGFADCVARGTYLDWPPYVTARAVAAGVEATPTVLVAGVAVPPESEAIAAAVEQVAARL